MPALEAPLNPTFSIGTRNLVVTYPSWKLEDRCRDSVWAGVSANEVRSNVLTIVVTCHVRGYSVGSQPSLSRP